MAKSKKQELIQKKKRFVTNEVDLLGDDDWVIVKKQKVTILIPPSPVNKQLTTPNEPRTQTKEIEIQSKNKTVTPTNIHSTCPIQKSNSLTLKKTKLKAQNLHLESYKGPTITNICSYPKAIKRLEISIDRSRLVNRRLRAVILEKKLKRVGGLSNWLVSLGLGCFVKIFQIKHVSKFHLASLTMEKLKDIGVCAVGPRRKLIHAIDCLCQPY